MSTYMSDQLNRKTNIVKQIIQITLIMTTILLIQPRELKAQEDCVELEYPAICEFGLFDGETDQCNHWYTSLNEDQVCPQGYTYNGEYCTGVPLCTRGTYDPNINKCVNQECASDLYPNALSYDGLVCGEDRNNSGSIDTEAEISGCDSVGVCPWEQRTCPINRYPPTCPNSGSLDPDEDQCWRPYIEDVRSADCGRGELDRSRDICFYENAESQAGNCETGWNAVNPECQMEPPPCYAGTYNNDTDHCIDRQCPTSYSPSGERCVATLSCTQGRYREDINQCEEIVCPHGNQYPCVNNESGALVCTPYRCGDPAGENETEVDTTSYQDDGEWSEDGECNGIIRIFEGKPKVCLRPGIKTLFFNCCSSNIETWFILVEMCDDDSLDVTQALDNERAVYIGEFCQYDWPVLGCVQDAEMYCVFFSELAKLIHEQGRPQLKQFGPDGNWGTPFEPNCEGFDPESFAFLDFGQIDLSAFYDDIEIPDDMEIMQGIEEGFERYEDRMSR